VKIYPGAGHGFINDHNPADATLLLRFLARISGTKSHQVQRGGFLRPGRSRARHGGAGEQPRLWVSLVPPHDRCRMPFPGRCGQAQDVMAFARDSGVSP
jgi:hypothetical protein